MFKTVKKIIFSAIPRNFRPVIMQSYLRLRDIGGDNDILYCPCCNKRSRRFLPYGDNTNAICPNCRSLERHRFLFWYLIKKTNILIDKQNLLHFAPEKTLSTAFEAAANIKYFSADIGSKEAMFITDITDISCAGQLFDCILCSHVLEHVVDDCKAIKEINRTLKKDGQAIIIVPLNEKMHKTKEDNNITSEDERERVWGQKDHVRIYGLDFSERLVLNDFSFLEINCKKTLSEKLIKKYALLENEYLYICRKTTP